MGVQILTEEGVSFDWVFMILTIGILPIITASPHDYSGPATELAGATRLPFRCGRKRRSDRGPLRQPIHRTADDFTAAGQPPTVDARIEPRAGADRAGASRNAVDCRRARPDHCPASLRAPAGRQAGTGEPRPRRGRSGQPEPGAPADQRTLTRLNSNQTNREAGPRAPLFFCDRLSSLLRNG